MKTIKIAHLYFDLMNLYGENGNVRFLKKKIEEQNINVEIYFLTVDDQIDFTKYDFFYIGTGSEENQKIVLEDIMKYKNEIKKAKDLGKFFLVTGNALDLFTNKINFKDGTVSEGIGLFDSEATEEEFRIVGEQYYTCPLEDHKIIGFQNRICTINKFDNYLFDVIDGCGLKPNFTKEGVYENNFYGTYLLGPLLVRNPYFCDFIIGEICKFIQKEYTKPNLEDACYIAYEEYIKNFYENQ